MTITRLSEEDVRRFADSPEIDMDLQIGKVENEQEDEQYVIVASGRIGIVYDEALSAEMDRHWEYIGAPARIAPDEHATRIEEWKNSLPLGKPLRPINPSEVFRALGFIHLGPRFPLPPLWPRPAYIYGHLPFHGRCSGTDSYYRYEQFPTSVRIDQRNQRITKSDTYAIPLSERDFTPTGLSAVARLALPLLLPACWRWELQPVQNTRMYYGACVPLYGQSGGAVEVCFPDPFKNSNAIPNPTVLAIL
jgi:hypothetical protein